jgi:hypothetical protein
MVSLPQPISRSTVQAKDGTEGENVSEADSDHFPLQSLGAVGVARSAVTDVTDDSNRPLAYTLVGLLWGLGGIVGSVLGGVLETPTEKYAYFADSELFAEYPYVHLSSSLSCLHVAMLTKSGSE